MTDLCCNIWQVLRDGHVTPASDVYSFAILMYEMYTRKHLFKGMMHSQVCLTALALDLLLPSHDLQLTYCLC